MDWMQEREEYGAWTESNLGSPVILHVDTILTELQYCSLQSHHCTILYSFLISLKVNFQKALYRVNTKTLLDFK